MAENVSCSYCDASKSSKTNDEVTLYRWVYQKSFCLIELWQALEILKVTFNYFFFCSFPEQRKNPVVYFKWCDVLNTEPKQEKLTKPLVCQNHFSRKDLDSTGLLKGTFLCNINLNRITAII